MIEAVVAETSILKGRDIEDRSFPPGTVVMAIVRDRSVLIPSEHERLLAGDELMLLVSGDGAAVRALVEGQ